MSSERHEENGLRARLAFYADFFGVLGGIILIVSFLLRHYGHSTLFLFGIFASCLFLFLWILDNVLKTSTSSLVTLGALSPDASALPRERVTPPLPVPQADARERLAPLDVSQDLLDLIARHYELKRLEPNLIHLPSEKLPAHEGQHGVIVEGSLADARNFQAVVQPYHNDPYRQPRAKPQRRIAAIGEVSAQLTYKRVGDDSRIEMHRGGWLSEKGYKAAFGINQKHSELIRSIS